MERHDVESGAVSRPIAATCNDSAAIPRDREYRPALYSRSRGITVAVTPASGCTAGQKADVGADRRTRPAELLLFLPPVQNSNAGY